jgi:hypothetical protein
MDDVKKQQWRSRAVLLLIVALFFSSFGIAALLRFTGWQPDSHKNFGRLLSPPLDFSAQTFNRANGQPYVWQPERNAWRVVLVSDQPCLAACQKQLDTLHRVWLSRGRHTERIDLLWFAEVPATRPDFKGFIAMQANAALRTALPELESNKGYPVYLIDPDGFVALHYPAGFDPSGLRKDLAKLVK